MSKKEKITIDVDVVISRRNLIDRSNPIDRGFISLEIDAHGQSLVQWKAGKGSRVAAKALRAENRGVSLDVFRDCNTF